MLVPLPDWIPSVTAAPEPEPAAVSVVKPLVFMAERSTSPSPVSMVTVSTPDNFGAIVIPPLATTENVVAAEDPTVRDPEDPATLIVEAPSADKLVSMLPPPDIETVSAPLTFIAPPRTEVLSTVIFTAP